MLFDELYDKPWTRLGPYLVGMFTGWLIFKTKARLNVSKVSSKLAFYNDNEIYSGVTSNESATRYATVM